MKTHQFDDARGYCGALYATCVGVYLDTLKTELIQHSLT